MFGWLILQRQTSCVETSCRLSWTVTGNSTLINHRQIYCIILDWNCTFLLWCVIVLMHSGALLQKDIGLFDNSTWSMSTQSSLLFQTNMTQLIYCFNPEIVKTLHVSITVHTIHFILWASVPPTLPVSTEVYCFPESPCDLLCRAQDYISAFRLWSGHTSWESENWLHRGVGHTSNHRLVLLLILLNGRKRWETLSHIKRQRPHFTHCALRSQLPTAHLQQGLMGLELCATVFDQSSLRFAWARKLERPTFNPTNLDGTEKTISSALTFTMVLNTSVTSSGQKRKVMFVLLGVFFSNITRFSFSHTDSALYWTLWVLLPSNHDLTSC